MMTKTKVQCMLCALSAALLTGCAGNEAFLVQQESIAPQAWTAGVPALDNTAQDTALWWQAWDNPELLALIGRADQANTDILTAIANLRSAAALADEATAALFPTLDLSAKGSSTRTNNRTSESYQAGVAYNWSLSLAGGNIAARRAARHEAMAAQLTLEDTRIAVAGEVAQNYVSLTLAYVKKQIAEMTLDNHRRALEIARWNNEAGLTDRTELEQAVSNMQQARASIPLLEQSIVKYRNALARLTGQSAATLAVGTAEAVPTAPMTLAVSLPAKTLKQRPDMRAAQ
ncbi:MAG: TolC family protein, partial [Duodenibacillus sp.]